MQLRNGGAVLWTSLEYRKFAKERDYHLFPNKNKLGKLNNHNIKTYRIPMDTHQLA